MTSGLKMKCLWPCACVSTLSPHSWDRRTDLNFWPLCQNMEGYLIEIQRSRLCLWSNVKVINVQGHHVACQEVIKRNNLMFRLGLTNVTFELDPWRTCDIWPQTMWPLTIICIKTAIHEITFLPGDLDLNLQGRPLGLTQWLCAPVSGPLLHRSHIRRPPFMASP